MHKDIIEILQYCRKKDLKISVLTNLIALKDELIPLHLTSTPIFLKFCNYLMHIFIYFCSPPILGTAMLFLNFMCCLLKRRKTGQTRQVWLLSRKNEENMF